ncbi:hypothetical protein GCM10008097_06840 [Mycetocola manganoxydans]|nr:hypothetical protein GCM10008097_06840 [Mycetocola manganoxydans]
MVAWLVSVAILVTSGRGVGVVDLIPLTLLQSWVPTESVYFAANAVFWSLSCEAFFYLVFPYLYRWMSQWKVRKLLIVGALLVSLVLSVSVAVSLTGTTEFGIWVVGFFPPTRLCEFVLGMILALLIRREASFAVPLWVGSFVALAGYAAANVVDDPYSRVIVTLVPFCLLIWSAAQADLNQRPSVLRAKPLVTLGIWSYSFYLIHTQAMTGAFEAMDRIGINTQELSDWWLFAAVAASFICAVAAAAALHYFVEAPLEKRLRGRRRSRSDG